MSSSRSTAAKRSAYTALDYGSEFEPDSEVENKKAARADLSRKEVPVAASKPARSTFVEERSRDEARYMRHHFISTNAYARHKQLVNNYLMYYGGKLSDFDNKSTHKTDRDVIKENHQFVWEEGEEADGWDKRLAKEYYDKLYKEYCLADLSRYKENKIAMRWRTEREVIAGKGQFICGNKTCDRDDDLKSWEVNFAYIEKDVKKNSLVKLRLCAKCSSKLNYTKKNQEIVQQERDDYESSASTDKRNSTDKRTDADMQRIVNGLLL